MNWKPEILIFQPVWVGLGIQSAIQSSGLNLCLTGAKNLYLNRPEETVGDNDADDLGTTL